MLIMALIAAEWNASGDWLADRYQCCRPEQTWLYQIVGRRELLLTSAEKGVYSCHSLQPLHDLKSALSNSLDQEFVWNRYANGVCALTRMKLSGLSETISLPKRSSQSQRSFKSDPSWKFTALIVAEHCGYSGYFFEIVYKI